MAKLQYVASAIALLSLQSSVDSFPFQKPLQAKLSSSPSAVIVSALEATTDQSLEDRVVKAIQSVVKNTGDRQPKQALESLGQFGSATGALVTQRWLTPQALEECASFWQEGSSVLFTDLKRLRLLPQSYSNFLWFSLLAANTFPWTPLLLPLVDRALQDTDVPPTAYLPPSFGDSRRKAWRRIQERRTIEENGDMGNPNTQQENTPQNIQESLRFFQDGTLLLWRDIQRDRLFRHDTLAGYAWFAFLAFSTFPLTPLCLPVLDKRRPKGKQSDYVPSAFRARRLSALTRAREQQAAKDPFQVLYEAATASDNRPSARQILEAIVSIQRNRLAWDRREAFPNKLGDENRRWRLIYTADKDAVVDMRKEQQERSPYWSARSFLPWSNGVYVDGFVEAIQRFDKETMENENGFFNLFGIAGTSFTVVGPYKWNRSICGFQPTNTSLVLGNGQKWEFPMGINEENSFDETPINKLPFFNFVLVDDQLAVAQGRSGGVALWALVKS